MQKVIPGNEAIDTGVFECTPGTYRRAVKQAEVMHFLAGRATFTPDGEAPLEIAPGDTLFFEANTEGLWQIDETIRNSLYRRLASQPLIKRFSSLRTSYR